MLFPWFQLLMLTSKAAWPGRWAWNAFSTHPPLCCSALCALLTACDGSLSKQFHFFAASSLQLRLYKKCIYEKRKTTGDPDSRPMFPSVSCTEQSGRARVSSCRRAKNARYAHYTGPLWICLHIQLPALWHVLRFKKHCPTLSAEAKCEAKVTKIQSVNPRRCYFCKVYVRCLDN